MSKWFSVKDRLPESGKYVLCYRPHRKDFDNWLICQVDDDKIWLDIDYFDVSDITHWMPLPSPPEFDDTFLHPHLYGY